ncbi:MAG TPA: hypothetical protein VK907_12195 [Phnomibacter sp.]|nr:hypothetical protein [Phnomibacter sp.]
MNATDTLLDLTATTDYALVHSPEWYRQLVEAVNQLVVNDFNALVQILYRLDVNEDKIRLALEAEPGTDAADIISRLLLERQLQKLESRKKYKSGDTAADNEERW